MSKNRTEPVPYVQPYRYASPNIPLSAIRRFARCIAEQFHPQKIILFGSYAYGTPHNESDVDLLVIMPAYDVVNQSIRIRRAFERPFVFDLIVRTPKQIECGFRDNNWFLREIVEKGKVLYEARDEEMGSQGRGGLGRRRALADRKPPLRDMACFHCQQAAEKYLKALLQESGVAIPQIHDLESVLELLLPHDGTLAPLRRILQSLSDYAVDYRYPNMRATTRQMNAALRHPERVRGEARSRLGLLL